MDETIAVVDNPTSTDILFGRHAQSWNHEGNRRFREIVSRYQDAYHSAKARVQKVAIVARIVSEVRENGARFLKLDSRLQRWCEVDRRACIEKVGHAIRDKQAIANRSLRGRQEQYLKKIEQDQHKTSTSKVKGFECAEGSEGTNKQASTPHPHLSFSGWPASEQPPSTRAKDGGAVPLRVRSTPSSSNALLTPAIIQDKLWMQMQQQHQKSPAPSFINGGYNAGRPPIDLAAASGLAILRHHREVEQAARKLVAAEELFASIRSQQVLEEELALLRRRRTILSDIALRGALPLGMSQDSTSLASAFLRTTRDLLPDVPLGSTLGGFADSHNKTPHSALRTFFGESSRGTTEFG